MDFLEEHYDTNKATVRLVHSLGMFFDWKDPKQYKATPEHPYKTYREVVWPAEKRPALVGDLVQLTDEYLIKYVSNFGNKSLRVLKEILVKEGLQLGMPIFCWDKGKADYLQSIEDKKQAVVQTFQDEIEEGLFEGK